MSYYNVDTPWIRTMRALADVAVGPNRMPSRAGRGYPLRRVSTQSINQFRWLMLTTKSRIRTGVPESDMECGGKVKAVVGSADDNAPTRSRAPAPAPTTGQFSHVVAPHELVVVCDEEKAPFTARILGESHVDTASLTCSLAQVTRAVPHGEWEVASRCSEQKLSDNTEDAYAGEESWAKTDI